MDKRDQFGLDEGGQFELDERGQDGLDFPYNFNQQKNNTLAITFSALALLFQPFLKITLGRTVWNVVDVVLALFLLFLFFRNKQ